MMQDPFSALSLTGAAEYKRGPLHVRHGPQAQLHTIDATSTGSSTPLTVSVRVASIP